MRVISYVVVFCFLTVSQSSLADLATSDEMVEGALVSHLRTKNLSVQGDRIAAARELASENARRDPDGSYSATVVFNKGMPAEELAAIADRVGLTISRIEIKVPSAPNGTVQTISIGAEDLLRIDGSQDHRIKTAIGLIRADFVKRADLEVGGLSDQHQNVAFAEMNIYKAEVIATARSINRLCRDRNVIAAFPDDGDGKIVAFEIVRDRYDQAHRQRKLELGVPPQ